MKKISYFIGALLLVISSMAWATTYTFPINSQNSHSFEYNFKLNVGDTVVAKINVPLGQVISMTTYPINGEAFCMTSPIAGKICPRAHKKWYLAFPATNKPYTKTFMYTKGQNGTTFNFQSGPE